MPCTKHYHFRYMKCFINDNKKSFILGTLIVFIRESQDESSFKCPFPTKVLGEIFFLVLYSKELSLYGGGVFDWWGSDTQCMLTVGDASVQMQNS